ncbi:histidine kinase N-terminal 7TM domain-containing protein [Halalkalicoccus jeotgali]|uniref:histidine kinase n=1 Tax=Halalkalicoccus jeotgali (strain DSM 18796 / CECT 7217 / JCM 14584 / KCTC 4019 / B3) TaxID=795797 RepID=D8J2G2_HALJB|nr:histidine kinase N-terminal 7TM domain-containing protein [Halalkalicoccus jeotgali]ADJ14919.1 histidine kinase [Halalkalicoccus jeotgali B3]ELY35065.1 histidine kinase [Halalkalicoccus jeotgali B3]
MITLSPTVALIVGSVLAAGSVGVLAWRQRPEPGSFSLAVLMAAAAWWSATQLGTLLAGTLPGALFWARLQWLASVTLPVVWLVFALEYTGYDRYVRRSVVAGLAIPSVLTLALLATNGTHGLIRESVTLADHHGYLVLQSTWGPWFYLIVGYAYVLVTVGSLLFVQLAIGASLLYRTQAIALLVGAASPWLAHLVYLSGFVPWAGLDLMGATFSVSGATLLFALARGRLLDANPAASRLASDFVIRGIDDGVLITDSSGRVVDLNPAVRSILGVSPADAVGRPAVAVVPGWDGSSAEPDSEVTTRVGDGARYFDVRVSVLTDYHDRPVGRAIVLRDVTERRRRRQRLTVLQRILRHNLRNEMTVIHGHAQCLEDEGNDAAGAIEESANRVLDLSQKASQIERLVAKSETDATTRLDIVIENAVRSLRSEHPGTTFLVGELPSVTVCVSIETAVYNLLENAAEHNTGDDPTVTVEASVSDREVRITVADDGPGIPPMERQVLQVDGETPLHHGSGIGLWLVHWTVELLGGTVTFGENDPIGSVVNVRVPVAGSPGGHERGA